MGFFWVDIFYHDFCFENGEKDFFGIIGKFLNVIKIFCLNREI
jgi:hypothetical protein